MNGSPWFPVLTVAEKMQRFEQLCEHLDYSDQIRHLYTIYQTAECYNFCNFFYHKSGPGRVTRSKGVIFITFQSLQRSNRK